MDFTLLAFPAFTLIVIASLLLLVTRDNRWSILALVFQYLGAFLLIGIHWSLEMAASVLIAGWMACLILGVSILETIHLTGGSWQEKHQISPSGSLFRLITAALALLTVYSLAPRIVSRLPGGNLIQVWGCLILVALGVLQLGLTSSPTRVIMGLFTILLGFEVFYAALESSMLVAGLLAFVTLGLAMIGAYLVVAPAMEEAG